MSMTSIVVAGKNDADDILADVVNVTLHRCEQDFSLRLDHMAGGSHGRLLGFHERRKVRDSLLHHPGRLDYLGQEHLARSEQITHHAHAVHQRAFDDQQRTAQFDASLFGIDLDVRIDSLDQRMRKTLFNCAVAPFFGLLFTDYRAGALSAFRHTPPGAPSHPDGD